MQRIPISSISSIDINLFEVKIKDFLRKLIYIDRNLQAKIRSIIPWHENTNNHKTIINITDNTSSLSLIEYAVLSAQMHIITTHWLWKLMRSRMMKRCYACVQCNMFFTPHCMKSARIRSFSGPYIQLECGKIRARITPNTDTFYTVPDNAKAPDHFCTVNVQFLRQLSQRF